MTASKRVSPRSLGSDLTKVATHVIQPEEYAKLPELTDDMLARGKVNMGGRPRSKNPKKLIFYSAARGCNLEVELQTQAGKLAWLKSSFGSYPVTPNNSLKLSTKGVARWSCGAGASPDFVPGAQRTPPFSPA